MPFAPTCEAVFGDVLQPALMDYDVVRGDTRLDERNILAKIITGIEEADLIVADLTDTNPNVLYELGVAHALGKPTILIAETVERLPFDIRSYPVHEYGAACSRAKELGARLRELAARHREGSVLFGNPVADFVRSINRSLPRATLNEEYTPQMASDDIAWAAEHIGQFFDRFTKTCEQHGTRLAGAIGKVRNLAAPSVREQGIREAADATREFSHQLDDLAACFHGTWEKYGRSFRWLLSPPVREHYGEERVRQRAGDAKTTDENLNGLLEDLAELRHVQSSFPGHAGGNLAHALDVSRASISNMLNEIMIAKAHLAWVIAQGSSLSA